MPSPTVSNPPIVRRSRFIGPNPAGKRPVRDLPAYLLADALLPREKKGEKLIDRAYNAAMLLSDEIQQQLLRPGKKDWNLIRNQTWCFGVFADKLLNTVESSEEIRVKLPAQLQDAVKLMIQLQIERAPQPVVSAPVQLSENEAEVNNSSPIFRTCAGGYSPRGDQ